MGELLNYPALMKQIRAEKNCSESEATKIIHQRHPGVRRAWERATQEQRAEAVMPAAGEGHLSRGDGGNSEEPAYTPITSETIRKGLGLTKKQWAERQAAKGGGTASLGEGDYFSLIATVRKQRGCGFIEAATVVQKEHPQAWLRMLEQANPGRDFAGRIQR